ncbi:hypothetical protein OUY22_00545 [Nonomuraea sp. MCN248]|uniref:Uncharacterized protein n=1 Tax=Nonomuraea corallina TaxID=2989783 RepID=A0ABT4S3X1_9ACTN|nr:hypothetical protein [Nonomuraea corallina]MDA0631889.1 hypothetical protein [Nonomuraea corallina]
MSRDPVVGARLEPVPAKGRANPITPLLALGAVPLLLAHWFIVAEILGRDCTLLYEGGNITECVGGLSEEEVIAVSGLVAPALLVIQMGLIVLVRRRIRGAYVEWAGD